MSVKAVKVKDETLPAEMFEGMEGFGTEFSQDEVVYPFISRIQTNSPQLIPGDSQYVEGAKPGDLLHTTTNKLYSELNFIPIKFQHIIIQWRDRDSGGGFVAAYNPGDPAIPASHKVDNVSIVTDDPQSYLEPNLQYVCAFFDGDEPIGPAILSCNKSQLKYAKKFNVALQNKKINLSDGRKISAPIFSHVYGLSTMLESNAKGSWFSYKFGEGRAVTDKALLQEMLETAKQMRESEQVFVPKDEQSEGSTDDAFEI